MDHPVVKALIYLAEVAFQNFLWIAVVVLVLALPAPYYAVKLIRRNRSLGGNIYSELAMADRFMQVWISETPLDSSDQQYIWAFVPNGNRAAAHYNKIDNGLIRWKLLKRTTSHETRSESSSLVEPMTGIYLVRNWLIFLLLLWLRITFFGDKCSHITFGGSKYGEKELKSMYKKTTGILILIAIFILFVINQFI